MGGVLFISKCDLLTKVYNQPKIAEDWKQNERIDEIYKNGEIYLQSLSSMYNKN